MKKLLAFALFCCLLSCGRKTVVVESLNTGEPDTLKTKTVRK